MRPAILAPIAWSFAVWYGGEGLGMLLTGQASSMTGAPGAVLLYGLLGAAAYPVTVAQAHDRLAAFLTGVVQFRYLRRALAGFWGLAAALQLQPYWWQPNQIAGAISAMEGQGTLNGVLFGSSLRWLAHLATGHEIVLNVAFLLVALGLAIGLVVARPQRIRPLLMGSIALSLLLWWTEGCGQLFTGSATDVNTGPLLMLLALACWPAARSAACSLPAKRITRSGSSHLDLSAVGAHRQTMAHLEGFNCWSLMIPRVRLWLAQAIYSAERLRATSREQARTTRFVVRSRNAEEAPGREM